MSEAGMPSQHGLSKISSDWSFGDITRKRLPGRAFICRPRYFVSMKNMLRIVGSSWRVYFSCLLSACALGIDRAYAVNTDYSLASSSSQLAVTYAKAEQSCLENCNDGQLAMTIRALSSVWLLSSEPSYSMALGVEFEYTAMDFDSINPMTNGHLHTWSLPLSWQMNHNQHAVFYNITPAISVSSNVLRNPDLADRQSLQLNATVIYRRDLLPEQQWLAGIAADHRFGEFRVYPVAGFVWRAEDDWVIQLAFPDSFIQKALNKRLKLELYAGPRGNQWHVYSKDKSRKSNLGYQSVVAGVSTTWQLPPLFEVKLNLERSTAREIGLTLDDNSALNSTVEAATAVMLSTSMTF